MGVWTRGVLFASSYAPLLLLFAVLGSFGRGWPSIVLAAVGVVSVIALVAVWLSLRRLAVDEVELSGARSRDADVMAYLVSYVVPFAALADAGGAATRWALVFFAALIAVLYLRSAVFYVHPLLLLAGIHVHDVARGDVPGTLLTRQRYLRQSARVRVVTIAPQVYVEVAR